MRKVLDKDLVQLDIYRHSMEEYQECSKSIAHVFLGKAQIGWRFVVKPSYMPTLNSWGFSEIHPNVLVLGME